MPYILNLHSHLMPEGYLQKKNLKLTEFLSYLIFDLVIERIINVIQKHVGIFNYKMYLSLFYST